MKNPDINKDSASRKKLIESGKALFYKYGYRKVTVEEICRDAGVSKMTFYRFFGNKTDMVRTILVEMAEEGIRLYRGIMDQDKPFEEKIRESIRRKMEMAKQFSEEFLADVYRDSNEEVMPMLRQMSADAMELVLEYYRKAQEEGHIRKDLNLHFIPYFINRMNDLVQDPALMAMYDNNLHDLMRELTNMFFYGILEQPGNQQDEK